MAIWSRWFGRDRSRSADQSAPARTITIGEVVNIAAHEALDLPLQRCLLCEANAPVEMGVSEARVGCADCGHYCVSLDAARALNALVKYRAPALAQMRGMMAAYRQSHPDMMPRIDVQYVVSDRVPTFCLSGSIT